jgi:hypothetical protein
MRAVTEEYDYTVGAEELLERARAQGWSMISIRDDWSSVFGEVMAASA